MRVLFTTTRGPGHLGPLLPFARACVRAGDSVLVAGPAEASPMVADAGFAFRPFADPPHAEVSPALARALHLPDDAANALVTREVFGRIDTTAALPRLMDTVDAWNPHVIVRDASELAAHVAAELRRIPIVQVAHSMIALQDEFIPYYAAGIAELRDDLGLPEDLTGTAMRSTPILTTRPPALEAPGAGHGRGDVHRFSDATAPAPLLPGLLPPGDAPLVYLSFGAAAPTLGFYPDLYRAAIDALCDLDARLLVTVGGVDDLADLGALPANVRVERWVPQRDVMPHARAMIGHGGSGSTCTALAAGVPLVLLPLFADQTANARRVVELGAGISLEGGIAATEHLADAVETVLAADRHRAAAGAVARELAGLPAVSAAVDLLTELAAVPAAWAA
jgi:UDP:flavonoid glycosyltransferase YjiC (YdhE family)